MTKNGLHQQWKKDEAAHFEGWDFSYIKDRYQEQKPPWDYIALAKELVKNSTELLDMATGGGEVFSQLAPFPKKTYAIEEWHPNVSVAEERLAPLGVKVIEVESDSDLPFIDGQFDLIVNRHGGYNMKELNRILQKGGQFFTQQVGGGNLLDLMQFFESKQKWPLNALDKRISEFEENGFTIKRSEEWEGKTTFSDVGAVVYFLKAIPWVVDDFSVDSHLPYLERLQEKLEHDGKLTFVSTRYLLHVIK